VYKAVAASVFLAYLVYADIPWILEGKCWREHTKGYLREVKWTRDRKDDGVNSTVLPPRCQCVSERRLEKIK